MMSKATRRELEAELTQLRASLAGLDKALDTITALADVSADALQRLIAGFADDQVTQVRVAAVVADVSMAWAIMTENLREALISTKH